MREDRDRFQKIRILDRDDFADHGDHPITRDRGDCVHLGDACAASPFLLCFEECP